MALPDDLLAEATALAEKHYGAVVPSRPPETENPGQVHVELLNRTVPPAKVRAVA